MTTPSTERKAGPLLGTGSQTSWPFTFKVFAATDIAVTIANSLGVETALNYGADYNVTLNANQETSPGGTVTYPISGTPLPIGSRLVIVGNLPYDQPLDLPAGGNFSPLALENELDRLTMQIQQLRENVGRALTVPVTSGVSPSLPSPAASNIIGWSENGDNLENYPLSELATSLAFATFRYDTFTGDGTTTQFTLSTDPVTLGNLDVAVGGVTQTPGTDYLLVDGVLAFTSAPPNGVTILARFGEGIASGPSMDSYDVRFRQAGTGAVDRTAEAKLREVVSVKDFGAKGNGIDDDTAAVNAALATGKQVYLPDGTYLANIAVSTSTFNLVGSGMGRAIIKPYNTGLPAFKNMADPGDANFWRRSSIRDVSLQGTGVGNGFTFGDPASYASGNERIGRVDFVNVEITGFSKGVFKTCGNIGNNYYNCRVQNNDYNFYAQSDDYASGGAAQMHTGFDNWYGGAWGYAGLADIFIKDRKLGKGGWVFNNVDIEGNSGYAVVALADATFDYLPNLVFDNCWFEANATGGSITIDGLTGTIVGAPRDLYLSGIKSVVAKGMYLGKLTLLNGTNLIADKCGTDTLTPGIFDLSKDASSTFAVDGWAYTTGMDTNLTLAPYASTTDNSDAAYTAVTNTVPGAVAAPVKDYTVLLGFSGTAPIVGGGGGYTGSVVSDGMTFNTCSEYVVSGSAARIVPDVTATVGKYYAVSYQARLVSGSNAYVYATNMAAAQLIDHSQWRQYSFVKKATVTGAGFSMNSFGASSTVRIGAMQIVQFDTAHEAYEYLYRGRIATNSDARSAAYPLAAFTDVGGGGGGASFNSANVAVTLTNSGYTKICEASFRGDLTKIKVDFLVAFQDLYTGGSLDQLSGFTTVAFSSTSDTPTQVFGAGTVTFRWVQQGSTSVWDLQGSVTTGPATAVALAGLAFVKGK
jgi:hypothetical protein